MEVNSINKTNQVYSKPAAPTKPTNELPQDSQRTLKEQSLNTKKDEMQSVDKAVSYDKSAREVKGSTKVQSSMVDLVQ